MNKAKRSEVQPELIERFRNLFFLTGFLIVFAGCKKDEPTQPEQAPVTPVVRIVSPTDNAQILDSTIIVVQVQIYIDNAVDSSRIFIVGPYRHVWTVRNLPDSSYNTIYAKAYDGDGNVSSTPVITVLVNRFAPTNLRVASVSSDEVKLEWQDGIR